MKTLLIFLSLIIISLLTIKLREPKEVKRQTNLVTPIVVSPLKIESQSDQEKLNLVESYLDQSGMAKNFSVPSLILEKHLNSPRLQKKFSKSEIEKLTLFFESRLGPDTIENLVKQEMIKKFDVLELEKLNKIYELDLMKKLKSIEEYFTSDEAIEKIPDQNLYRISQERIDLLNQLISAQQADFYAKVLTFESISGLHRGLKRILPKEKRVPDSLAEMALKIISNTPESKFKNTLLVRYRYLYQDLSEIELKNLIELSNNKIIKKARNITMEGIKLAFQTI